MDSTGDRIVAAATTEFSRYGIAGARIERIAKAARTSKERLYAHFRGKEALYAHVVAQELAAMADATRMDPTDLPGYAGRLHDYYLSHPDQFRLMMWGQMELGTENSDPVQQTVSRKLALLEKAQRNGQIDPSWAPLDVLVLVNQIAQSWARQDDLVKVADDERDAFLADRRAAVVAAVERLFPAVRQ